MTHPLRLIVGLGNPGAEYSETRHNAGFWFCERLARELSTSLSHEGRFHGIAGNARTQGLWILLPQTFMNRSGLSVRALAQFYKIEPSEILVVHDELDIPPGQLRLKFGGGSGGLNGLKDISQRLGSHDYWRLRIGVGKPPAGNEGADYVLQRPPADERSAIDWVIDKALEVLPLCLSGDMQTAMQKLHTEEKPPAPKTEEKAGAAKKEEKPAAAAVKEPEKKGLFSGLLGRKK